MWLLQIVQLPVSHSLYQLKLVGDPNLAQYPGSFDVVGRTGSNLQSAGHSNLRQQSIKQSAELQLNE